MVLKNKKHQAFVDEYFLQNMNGTDAYVAVYPKSSREAARRSASDLLTNPDIQAEISWRLKEHQLSADEVLARLGTMARADVVDFADVRKITDLKKDEYKGKTHVIKKFKSKITTDMLGRQIEEVELELYGADSVLVNLGRHHKLFTDKVELTGWQKELLDLLKQGGITPKDIESELGPDIAQEFFKQAGLHFAGVGAAEADSQTTKQSRSTHPLPSAAADR